MFQTQTRTTGFILGVVKWGKKKGGGLQGRQIKRGWKLLYNKSPSIISNGKLLVLSIE